MLYNEVSVYIIKGEVDGTEVFTLTERRNNKIERRGRIKSRGRTFPRERRTLAALGMSILLLGCALAPAPAAAAGSLPTSTAQATASALPLLAALGVGIAVAVGAVIAFLQMTAQGKAFSGQMRVSSSEDADTTQEQQGPFAYGRASEPANEQQEEEEEEHAEDALTDYTIPITRILSSPDAAEPAEASEPRLCGIEGEHAGESYRLLNRRLLIGRDSVQCGVVFPFEASEVSRKHCTVEYDPERRVFFLEDHGSSNGTFLASGVRLEPGKLYELRDGERFSLSGARHSFVVKAGE